MANPLKVLTDLIVSGSTSTSGSLTVGGNGALTVNAGGSVSLPNASIANAALQGSGQVTVGSTSIALGATATSIEGLTTVDTTNLEVSSVKAKDGTAAITIADSTGIVTVTNLTASTVAINGGAINGTTIGATTQSTAKFTTISGSSNLDVGGTATILGGLSVTGGSVTLPATSIANAALQGSGKVTIGGTDIALGASAAAFGNLTGLSGSQLKINANEVTASSITASSNVIVGGNLTFGNQLSAGGGYASTGLTISTNGNIQTKGSGTFDGDLTVGGNLYVNGATTTVNTENLLVKDPIVLIGSASNPSSVDVGLIFGASNRKALKWDHSASEFVLGSTDSDGSASSINITGRSDLKVGSLDATEAILSSGSVKDINLGIDVGAVIPLSGSALGLNGFESNAHLAILSASFHGPVDLEATVADIKSDIFMLDAAGGVFGALSGINMTGKGVSIISNNPSGPGLGGGGIVDSLVLQVTNDGGQSQLAGGTIKLSAETIKIETTGSSVTGTLFNGKVNLVVEDNYSYITKTNIGGYDVLNLTGALKQLDTAIGGMNGASVSPTEYYNVRTVVSGTKQAGNSSIVFTLSGNVQGQNGRTPNGSTITGLSASTPSLLIQKLGGMSFDVAIRDMASSLWSNDLVSVQVSASALSNGFYWPIVTVDAPAATDGAEIRLIAVNETANIIT